MGNSCNCGAEDESGNKQAPTISVYTEERELWDQDTCTPALNGLVDKESKGNGLAAHGDTPGNRMSEVERRIQAQQDAVAHRDAQEAAKGAEAPKSEDGDKVEIRISQRDFDQEEEDRLKEVESSLSRKREVDLEREEAEAKAAEAIEEVLREPSRTIRGSKLSIGEEEHFQEDMRRCEANPGAGCCVKRKHPEDRGRCARGTMVPISLGQKDGEQISLEQYLKNKQEKELGGHTTGGFAC